MILYQNLNKFSNRSIRKTKHRKISKAKAYSGWTNAFNYLKPQIAKPLSEVTYVSQQSLDSSGLSWQAATTEQLDFIRKVYDINLSRMSNRTFVNDVPDQELEPVEGRFELRTNAAQSCIRMFQAAREAITTANQNVQIGFTSAYRSASHQFSLWNDYFISKYYPDTQLHRQGLDGGVHGEAAARYLARYIRVRIAIPGYSNHNNGLAMDIKNTQNGSVFRNRTNSQATAAWRTSWLWDWLTANAATYNFYQNTHIDEPWHWVYRS